MIDYTHLKVIRWNKRVRVLISKGQTNFNRTRMREVLAVCLCWLFLASTTAARILSTVLFDSQSQSPLQTSSMLVYQFTVVSAINIEISLTRLTASTSSYVLMCSSINSIPSIINADVTNGKMTASADQCDYLNNELNSLQHYSFFSNFQLTQGDTIYIAVFLSQQPTYSEQYSILAVSSFLMLCPNSCSNHGTCSANGQCLCNDSYSKDDCSVQVFQIQKNIARTVTLSNTSAPAYLVLDFSSDYFQDSSVSYVAVSIIKAASGSNSADIDVIYKLFAIGSNELPSKFNNLQKQTVTSDLIMIYFLQNEVTTLKRLVISLSQSVTSSSTIAVTVSATEEKGIFSSLSASFVIIFVCSIVAIFIIGFIFLLFCYVRKKRARQVGNIVNASPNRNTNRVSPKKLTLGSGLLNKCMPVMKYSDAVELLEQAKRDQLKVSSFLTQQEKSKLANFSSAPMLQLKEFPVENKNLKQIIAGSSRVAQQDRNDTHENNQNVSAVQDLSQSMFQNNFTDEVGAGGGEECQKIKQEQEDIPVDLKDQHNTQAKEKDCEGGQKDNKNITVNGESNGGDNKIIENNKENLDQNEGAPTCAVCLGEFQPTDEVRISICEHIFHRECLESWLKKQENCPLCRKEFLRSNLQEWYKTKQRQILKIKRILTMNSCSSPSKDKADSLILNKLGATNNSVRNIIGQSMCNQSEIMHEGQQQNSMSMSYYNCGVDLESYSMRDQGSQWKHQVQVMQQTRELDQFNQQVIQEEEEEKRDNNNGDTYGRISRTIDVFDGYGFSRRETNKKQVLPVSQSTNNPRFMQQFSIKRKNNITNQVSKSSGSGNKLDALMVQSNRERSSNMNEINFDNNDRVNGTPQNEITLINSCEVDRASQQIANQQGEQEKKDSKQESHESNIPDELTRLERDKGINEIAIFYGQQQQNQKNNTHQQLIILDGDRNKGSLNAEMNQKQQNQGLIRILERNNGIQKNQQEQYNSIDLSSQSNEQIEQFQKHQQQQQREQTDQSELMPIEEDSNAA